MGVLSMAYMLEKETKPESAMEIAGSCQVYLAQDVQKILGIGRSRCYTFLGEVYKEQAPFRVIKIVMLIF